MNNSYYSPSLHQYSASYNYVHEYPVSTTPAYCYSISTQPSCPVHSPRNFYASSTSPSMNISLVPSSYYQPQNTELYSPCVQRPTPVHHVADRTPLRRHRCFKKNEIQILHQAYNRDSHPSTETLQQLAVHLEAPIEKVRQWFKNRRHSDKQKKRIISMTETTTTSN
ncbi:unnamed protein product [Rotaria socialis]|uniref:Homeobox domain-containing protein n=1 Tax=Rotaria socialis TaxID=392032 RepID=A0A819X4H9_9BILA|nr:unnamed protein product [Rotaria socialis]CAF3307832.1 unnamed protein product [Rotaria socialis]CAF4134426.1 unnamed protein product [Rotaria socialis]CAF4447130.1 unnamed protein product [Rotaria socialis]